MLCECSSAGTNLPAVGNDGCFSARRSSVDTTRSFEGTAEDAVHLGEGEEVGNRGDSSNDERFRPRDGRVLGLRLQNIEVRRIHEIHFHFLT